MPACFPQGGFTAEPAAAKTARELQLKSGDIVLLAGIDVPADVETRARERLQELIAGQKLRYVPLLSAPDRYSRISADAALETAPPQWLQGALVEEGLALAMPLGIKSACMKELLFLEGQAQQKKAGLWAQPAGIVLQADDMPAFAAAQGQFRVVEGRVLNVGKRDYATFLNFGRVWKQDFTVIVLKKNRDAVEAMQPLASLAGKKVRVRGILKADAQPRLTLEGPEALEVLE